MHIVILYNSVTEKYSIELTRAETARDYMDARAYTDEWAMKYFGEMPLPREPGMAKVVEGLLEMEGNDFGMWLDDLFHILMSKATAP